MPEVPWRAAIMAVLLRANSAMHYSDIATAIVREGLRLDSGGNPAQTVASMISFSIREEGERSPFVRVSSGHYALRGSDPAERQAGTRRPVLTSREGESSSLAEYAGRSNPRSGPENPIRPAVGAWQGELVENSPLFPEAGPQEDVEDTGSPPARPSDGTEPGFPELGEETYYDQEAPEGSPATPHSQEQANGKVDDLDDRRLLDELTGASSDPARKEEQLAPLETDAAPDDIRGFDFLERLAGCLRERAGCRVERILAGLKIDLKYGPGVFEPTPTRAGRLQATLDYKARQGVLCFSAFLPCHPGCEQRLLRLVGTDGFTCRIGIHDLVGQERFVARRTIDTRGLSEEETAGAIEEALADAVRASIILEE